MRVSRRQKRLGGRRGGQVGGGIGGFEGVTCVSKGLSGGLRVDEVLKGLTGEKLHQVRAD